MMIQINPITAPTVTTHPGKTGNYRKLEIAYKEIGGRSDGRVGAKKLVSFNDEDTFNKVAAAVPGTLYNIENVKEGEYWVWKTFEEALGEPMAPTSVSAAAKPAAASPAAARVSTYETSEERAARQRFIVRQSSIGHALEYAKHNNQKTAITVEEILRTAEAFERFVFGENLDDDPFAGMTDDIPE